MALEMKGDYDQVIKHHFAHTRQHSAMSAATTRVLTTFLPSDLIQPGQGRPEARGRAGARGHCGA
eukprot:scaffold129240_cov54-Phaeocystis_antarctica.AAC.1